MCTLLGCCAYWTQNKSNGTEPFDVNSIWNGVKLILATKGFDCCEEDDFDALIPCELNNKDLIIVTTSDDLEYADIIKG